MIDLHDVKKTYLSGDHTIEALKGITLHVDKADVFGVIGYSGAGKSTLIRCINLLEKPDSGTVFVNGQEITSLSTEELRKTRQKIGMIFQSFNLLKSATVYQNVALPLRHLKMNKKSVREKVEGLLELVGLSDKLEIYPSQLSGGQKQRVAIARALANDPQVLLSDEATSALDPQTTYSILALLDDLNKKLGLTIVLITHEMQVIKEVCNKVAVIDNGMIVEHGATIDIFSHAAHSTTQKLIANLFQSGKIIELFKNEEISALLSRQGIIARLMFAGQSAHHAYISELARKFNVDINVVFANIEIVKSLPVGSLFVIFSGEPVNIKMAMQYLEQKSVSVTIISQEDIIAGRGGI